MTDDLVKRLRAIAQSAKEAYARDCQEFGISPKIKMGVDISEEAADAIARLTAERDAAQVALNRLYDACELRANKEGGDTGPEIGPAIYHIDEIRALSPSTLNKPE